MGGCCEHGSGENKVRKTPELCGVKDTKTEGIAFFLAEVYANLRFVFPSTSSNSIFCLTGFAQGWGRGSGWQVGFVRPEQFVIQTSVISSGDNKTSPASREQFWFMPLLSPKHLSQKFGLQNKVPLHLQRTICRGWSLEGKIRALTGNWILSLDHSEPLYLVQPCRVHGTWQVLTMNEWTGECMNELAGNKYSCPLSWICTSQWPSALPFSTGNLLAIYLCLVGCALMLAGCLFGVNQGTEVFNLLQSIGSSPTDPFLWPGLKFLSWLSKGLGKQSWRAEFL